MLAVTGWCLVMWTRITVALALLVAGTWLAVGDDSRWFWGVAVGSVFLELYATRQLAREWASEARSSWWWSP